MEGANLFQDHKALLILQFLFLQLKMIIEWYVHYTDGMNCILPYIPQHNQKLLINKCVYFV